MVPGSPDPGPSDGTYVLVDDVWYFEMSILTSLTFQCNLSVVYPIDSFPPL